MAHHELDTALLFTPGRASYVTSGPDGTYNLNLTEGSEQRAQVAARLFDDQFHTIALFAGGYPGIAENWPPEHTPPLGSREADLMAQPLRRRLLADGWSQAVIDERVKRQGISNNSIGDVLHSINEGFLDPDDFHCGDEAHGIHLVTGQIHGVRFRDILSKALDIDKRLILRADMHDKYSAPATEFRDRQLAPVVIAKQYAAIAVTRLVLKDVRPGNIEDLRDAEQRFNQIVAKISG